MAKAPRSRSAAHLVAPAAGAPVPAPPADAATPPAAEAPAPPDNDGAAVDSGDQTPVAAPPSQSDAGTPSLADEATELALTIDADGNVELEMLTGLSGPEICLTRGDPYRCSAAEGIRMVRAEAARPVPAEG